MMRLDNWQVNLSDLIRKREFEPFDIVSFNCLMWASEAVAAVTGVDPYLPFVDTFKTAAGAAKQLRLKGKSETSADYMAGILGEKLHLAFVKKGDIVAIESSLVDMPADALLFGAPLGVCYGANSYFVGSAGLVAVPTLSLGPNTYGFHC
jgi:hypothetical protein